MIYVFYVYVTFQKTGVRKGLWCCWVVEFDFVYRFVTFKKLRRQENIRIDSQFLFFPFQKNDASDVNTDKDMDLITVIMIATQNT